MGRTIFASYAREDKRHIEALAAFIESKGHRVWWDHLLVPGEDYRASIAAQIKAADKVIVLWSRHSVLSPFVIDEAERANRLGKLVPIVLDGCEPPMGFGHLHAVMANTLASEYPAILAGIEGRSAPERGGRTRHKGVLAAGALLLAGLGATGAGYWALGPGRSPTAGLDPAMDYRVFNSAGLGIRMVYPQARLMVDTTREAQGRIPLITADRRQEVVVTRLARTGPDDPQVAREAERQRLHDRGYQINYSAPLNPASRANWYVLSGMKPDGTEFYYRRWYVDDDIVSIEFEYNREEIGFYNKAIDAMTLNGRFEMASRR